LGQAVKGLIGDADAGPVLAHVAEVVIEGTILLGEENDVIDVGFDRAAEGCGYGAGGV
jgi:hypothetical protein